jgi:hypothetical protein
MLEANFKQANFSTYDPNMLNIIHVYLQNQQVISMLEEKQGPIHGTHHKPSAH